MEKLEYKIRNVWLVQSTIIGIIISSTIAIAITFLNGPAIISITLMLLIPSLLAVHAVFRYKNWGFEPKEDHVYIKYGVLRKVFIMVPHVRIQHIDTRRSPIERILGLSSLKIYTAGSRGADVRIPGLKKERARKLQEELRDVAIESEKGFDGV